MALTKTDLNSIQEIVKTEVTVAKKELSEKIEKTVDEKIEKLARMVNKGFEEQSKELKTIRKELAVHDFKMTEMVHKAEYYKIEERVTILERKTGIKV